ncbi:MAG: PQQ-binding-like beta-propeller repeat protein [Pirellulales bacterium]
MPLHNPRSIVLVVCLALVGLVAAAADWPQWRGPQRDGISRETGLLKQWPKEGPKLLWQIENLGDGYSTPAVVGDRLYVMCNPTEKDELVHALSIKDGSQIWATRVGGVGENPAGQNYPGTRATPTVDGALLYVLGSDGDLACVERSSGNIQWQKNLRSDFGGQPGRWAYAESPLIDGDVLVCTPGGADATIVALDKKSGEAIWKSAVPGGDEAAYASVIIVETDGIKHYVQFLQKGLVGVDARTGEFRWRYEKTAQGSPANIPTPVAQGGMVYSASNRGGGGSVRLNVTADGVVAEEVYFSKSLPTSIGGAVLLDGYLYGTTGQSTLCVDFKSGDVKWQERGIGAGAMLYADGRLYVHGENGDVALIEATPEEYHERGKFKPSGQPKRGSREQAWTYPVVANGRLYIRDKNVLWCYDVRQATN